MKILWISYFGSWTLPLLDRIKQGNTVGIIVPGYHTHTSNYQRDGITFYEVAFKKGICHKTMTPAVFNQYYKQIIEQFQPDLIHVHGTEKTWHKYSNLFLIFLLSFPFRDYLLVIRIMLTIILLLPDWVDLRH